MKNKAAISTDQAPQAIGTYSQAIKAGETVFLSGQIPLIAGTAELISGNFKDQTTQVFSNLEAVCIAAGGDLSNIAKLSIYLTDLNNFTTVNAVMAELFHEPYPARAVVEVSRLPKEAHIEVEGIMVL